MQVEVHGRETSDVSLSSRVGIDFQLTPYTGKKYIWSHNTTTSLYKDKPLVQLLFMLSTCFVYILPSW